MSCRFCGKQVDNYATHWCRKQDWRKFIERFPAKHAPRLFAACVVEAKKMGLMSLLFLATPASACGPIPDGGLHHYLPGIIPGIIFAVVFFKAWLHNKGG